MRGSDRPLVVVGAGITGLAAAWHALTRHGRRVILCDSATRAGGKLRSSQLGGVEVDEGADAFLARVPEGRELCEELGCADELVAPLSGRAWLRWEGENQPLPDGLVLGVPTDPIALSATRLVPATAVRRLVAEVSRAGSPLRGDVSLGSLIRSRFGDEVAERLVEPLLGGINAGLLDRLSLDACAPQLAAAAHSDASLVRALRSAPPPDADSPVFLTLPDGMGGLGRRLSAALLDGGAEIRTGVTVTAVGSGTVTTSAGEIAADGIVLATPARATAALIAAPCPEAAAILGAMRAASVVVVTASYPRSAVADPLDGAGLLVPRGSGRHTTAVSFASTKWAHQSRPDQVILRTSLGHDGDPEAARLSDAALLEAVALDLDELLGVTSPPSEVRISRWEGGFPQYEPGHLDRVAAAESALRTLVPGVALAGAWYRGLGIPACIRQGRAAVDALVGG